MTDDGQHRLEDLLSGVVPAAGSAAAGPCPADDLLVGLAQQQLPERTAEQVRAHLLDCDVCRETVGLLADEPLIAEDRPTATSPRLRLLDQPGRILALAACLLVGVGLVLLWQRAEAPGSTDARLVAAVQTLAAADPEHFASFQVLGVEERRSPHRPDLVRGGVTLRTPRHTVLSTEPGFLWASVLGASVERVTLYDPDGTELWTREVEHGLPTYPADEALLSPGASYLWTVSSEGVNGPVSGRAVFRVADEATRRRYEEARERIAETVDADLAPLVEAHLAIRLDLYVRAAEILEAPDLPHRDDPVAVETRTFVARRLYREE